MQYWGRDASPDDRLPIEWIVKRQCADTAALVGLHDRGVLEPGRRADLNLIDFDALAIGMPQMLHDLPAGGKRLVQRAIGIPSHLRRGRSRHARRGADGCAPWPSGARRSLTRGVPTRS